MSKLLRIAMIGMVGFVVGKVMAADVEVAVSRVEQMGAGSPLGVITIEQTQYGLLFKPNLQGLGKGVYAFHVHETASCDNFGMAAQGHYDPQKTDKHRGPFNDSGHLGDLPPLVVNLAGKATLPVLAPRLQLKDLANRVLIIHRGSDNYSDTPEANGGGGDRIACGLIPPLSDAEIKASEVKHKPAEQPSTAPTDPFDALSNEPKEKPNLDIQALQHRLEELHQARHAIKLPTSHQQKFSQDVEKAQQQISASLQQTEVPPPYPAMLEDFDTASLLKKKLPLPEPKELIQ